MLLEALENRSLLAPLINSGTAAEVIYNLPASPSSVFLEDDGITGNGTLQLRTTSGTFDTTIFANPSGSLTINRGNAADTITINAVPDFTASLTIGSAAVPPSAITFADAMTLSPDKSLTAFVSGTISLSNGSSDIAVSGSGGISLTTASSILLASGSSITSVNGAIALSANQQATPTSGNFAGISVNGGTIQSTGTGAVTVQGRGGTNAGGNQYGVQLQGTAKVSGGTAGAVTVVGQGGNSTGSNNWGVDIVGPSTSTVTLITSIGADVLVTGFGGGTVNSSANSGVSVRYAGQITSGGGAV